MSHAKRDSVYADTVVADAHTPPSGSVRSQLATWHTDPSKGFLWNMIPKWHNPPTGEEPATKNPFKLLAMVGPMGWLFFFSGWFAWTCDGYDFFAVSLTVTRLSKQFNVDTKQITTAITLTLLFRSLGALLFGVLADRFGRKWTLVCNLILIAVFELGSGFCNTYPQFLAVRSLFGIAMGGIWGQAAATALENVPVAARGLCSGIMQQGYSVGYLLAAVINLTVVPKSKYTWRSLYFIGAGFSLAAAIVRALLPESRQYILAREEAKAAGHTSKETSKAFMREIRAMLKTNWLRWIWAVCMMTGFNFFSHGSQDLYPKMLEEAKGLSSALASKATIISNCGADKSTSVCDQGPADNITGRRNYRGLCIAIRRATTSVRLYGSTPNTSLTGSILICLLYTAAWIPLWIIPDSFSGLSAGAFFVQSGVQGAWGVVPIYLSEVAPPAFRATFGGLAYQLGNMASSGASQIEADAGASLKLKGTETPDYATIMAILIGAVIAWMIVCVFLGPEADGAHFEQARVATVHGAGKEAPSGYVDPSRPHEEKEVKPEHVDDIEAGRTRQA